MAAERSSKQQQQQEKHLVYPEDLPLIWYTARSYYFPSPPTHDRHCQVHPATIATSFALLSAKSHSHLVLVDQVLATMDSSMKQIVSVGGIFSCGLSDSSAPFVLYFMSIMLMHMYIL